MKNKRLSDRRWNWRFLGPLALSMVTLLASISPGYAVEPACDGLLSQADYREGNHTVLEVGISAFSRRPEPNSLEDRKPGIAKAILGVMYGRMPYFRWIQARPLTDVDASEFFLEIQKVKDDLRQLPISFNLGHSDRDRFDSIEKIISDYINASADTYSSFMRSSEKINNFTTLVSQIQSTLFELLISTFIDGESFWFHQMALEFYKGPRQTLSGRIKRHKGDHEVDIIILRRNGRELWVEAKNNSIDWSLNDYASWLGKPALQLSSSIVEFHRAHELSRAYSMNDSMLDQMKSQKALRDQLGMDSSVDLLLVSKYPIPQVQHLELHRLGIQSWPSIYSAEPFLPIYFRDLTQQIFTP